MSSKSCAVPRRLSTLGRRFSVYAIVVLWTLLASSRQADSKPTWSRQPPQGLSHVLEYISSAWNTLTRSMNDCHTVVDPKLHETSILYIPPQFTPPPSVKETQKRCHIQIKELPVLITGPGQVSNAISPPGLLYLENSYVVPGGRFNEMYGWDSYFIVRGLLEESRIALARGMVENFFFEIDHYGTVLNANRTYFLTRSQPPFLTSMIMAVYQAEKAAGHEDRAWLERGYQFASKDYAMWNREPHVAGDTGLSRYFDFGNGPAPESLKDETDFYRKVAGYFLLHWEGRNYVADMSGGKSETPVAGAEDSVRACDVPKTMAKPECEDPKNISLTADYYKGDRAMRESGFDISFRFGPYGGATHHYAPVCLNSLLYKTEKDLQQMSEILGRKDDAKRWQDRARDRKKKIQTYLWDTQRGMFFDYGLDKRARS